MGDIVIIQGVGGLFALSISLDNKYLQLIIKINKCNLFNL